MPSDRLGCPKRRILVGFGVAQAAIGVYSDDRNPAHRPVPLRAEDDDFVDSWGAIAGRSSGALAKCWKGVRAIALVRRHRRAAQCDDVADGRGSEAVRFRRREGLSLAVWDWASASRDLPSTKVCRLLVWRDLPCRPTSQRCWPHAIPSTAAGWDVPLTCGADARLAHFVRPTSARPESAHGDPKGFPASDPCLNRVEVPGPKTSFLPKTRRKLQSDRFVTGTSPIFWVRSPSGGEGLGAPGTLPEAASTRL